MRNILKDVKAKIAPQEIVMVIIAFFVFAVTFMISMDQIAGATHTKWNAAIWTMFYTVLPILAIVGVIIGFLMTHKKGMAMNPVVTLTRLYEKAKSLFEDHKAGISVNDVIWISVAVLLVALLFPVAMNNGVFGNTAVLTWAATPVYTLFSLVVPIIVVIAIAIRFIPHGGKK